MAHYRLIAHFERAGVPPGDFDHFDYVEAFQQLPELDLQAHPKRRRLAEHFAARCLDKLQAEEERAAGKAEKSRNFLERVQVYEAMRQERLAAMRYIEERYDSKCGQLKFYPKLNSRLATQKGRCWKDSDGFEAVEDEPAIRTPNSSAFADYYSYAD